MKNYILSFCFFVMVLSSCHSSKNISQNNTSRIGFKKLNTLVKNNNFKFEYFSSKVRVNYNKQSFTANIRMKKNAVIWISFTGPFSIEGARVLITPSSFKMYDKLNRVSYNMPLSFVENYIPIKADFKLLENLILGNFLEKAIKKQKIETKENTYSVKGDTPGIETFYSILKTGKVENILVTDKENNKEVEIRLQKYEKLDNQDFALKRKFLIQDGEKDYLLDLKFYKYKKGELEFPFDIPSGYAEYKP